MVEGLPAVKIMDETRLPIEVSTKGMDINAWHEENALLLPIWKEVSKIKEIGIFSYVASFLFQGQDLRMPNENDLGKGKGDGLPYLCEILFKKVYMNKMKSILDVGCGRGQAGIYFSTFGLDYVGVDVSVANIGFSLMLLRGMHGFQSKKPQYKQMIAEKLDFEDRSFDIVFTNHAMEHFHNLDKAFSEMFRVGRNVCGVVALPEEVECGQHMYKIDALLLDKYLQIGCISYNIETREKETVYWGECK